MLIPVTITVLLLAGSGVFLFLYHIRTRRFDPSHRRRVTSWHFYEVLDWYLKISTLGITLASLYWDHPLLARVHDVFGVKLAGLALAGCALALFAAAIRTLDAQFTPAHFSHVPDTLVTTGPYRYIRHPIYTANLLLIAGLLLVSGSLWLVLNLLILATFYAFTMAVEEAAIRSEFPAYEEYAQRTGRIFPRGLLGGRGKRTLS